MRFEALVSSIAAKMGKAAQALVFEDIWKWSIQNHGLLQTQYIACLSEEETVKAPVKLKSGETFEITKQEHSDFFIGLANTYVNSTLFDEGIKLFEEMLKRGSNESTMLNDYGRALLVRMVKSQSFNKSDTDLARKLIFEAYDFDKKVVARSFEYPAYTNLCYLRAVEAFMYACQGDPFAAFVIGWMSIEMTITRIWHKFLALKSIDGQPLEELSVYSILTTLSHSDVDSSLKAKQDLEEFKKAEGKLNYLRIVRNNLLHGDSDNPSSDDMRQCVALALLLCALFQSADSAKPRNSQGARVLS